MVVAFYFRLHLAYFPRPVVAIFARPEQRPPLEFSCRRLSSTFIILKPHKIGHAVQGK